MDFETASQDLIKLRNRSKISYGFLVLYVYLQKPKKLEMNIIKYLDRVYKNPEDASKITQELHDSNFREFISIIKSMGNLSFQYSMLVIKVIRKEFKKDKEFNYERYFSKIS